LVDTKPRKGTRMKTSLLLAASLVVALAACGKEASTPSAAAPAAQAVVPAAPAAAPAAPAAESASPAAAPAAPAAESAAPAAAAGEGEKK